MKILVTGSNGFIGRHVVTALETQRHTQPHIVHGFDLPENDITEPIEGDYDVIYHLAAYGLLAARDNPEHAVAVNVRGTVNVLEAARRSGATVIYSSASSVYGIPQYNTAREPDPLAPTSVYGVTKLAAEHMVRTYGTLYNIPYTIFRFTNVYGPGQHVGAIPSFIDSIQNGKTIKITGTGKQTRDFVYVKDVVSFLLEALSRDESRVYNLGSGHATSIRDLAVTLYNIADKKEQIQYTKRDVDERWGFGADLTALNTAFGTTPQTTIQDGLKMTWEAAQDNGI